MWQKGQVCSKRVCDKAERGLHRQIGEVTNPVGVDLQKTKPQTFTDSALSPQHLKKNLVNIDKAKALPNWYYISAKQIGLILNSEAQSAASAQ